MSPVKGGFKIPISPVKQQVKFSVVPTNNNIVKRVDKSQIQGVGSFQPKSVATNFQFQTIPQGNVNKMAPSSVPNQTFTIQTMNQAFQASGVRPPCTVRLIPANGQQSSQPTLIPVQPATDQRLQAGNIVTTGHPKIVHHQQPFVSFQQVRPITQIKPQPRLIMPAASSPATKIANLSQGATLVKTSSSSNNMGSYLISNKYVEQLKKQTYQPFKSQDGKILNASPPPAPETIPRAPPPPPSPCP